MIESLGPLESRGKKILETEVAHQTDLRLDTCCVQWANLSRCGGLYANQSSWAMPMERFSAALVFVSLENAPRRVSFTVQPDFG